tara:strand:- start:519 stop:767 length:249 start_codon:yes stop_codon:yes gene_type:complete
MYLKCLLLIILFLIILKPLISVEGFDNCTNTPNIFNSHLENLKKQKHPLLLGYNPNDYIYKTLLMESKVPLPVNANYWYHKY